MARLITRNEAAQLLDVEQQTVSNWVNKGVLNGHMADGRLLIDRASIVKYFDELKDLAFMEKRIHSVREELNTRESELNETLSDVCNARVILGNGVPSILFRDIFNAVLESAGQVVLDERSAAVLRRMVIRGQDPEQIAAAYGLTRSRIMQIAQRAVRSLACMQNYSDLRQEVKRLNNENEVLRNTVHALYVKNGQLQLELEKAGKDTHSLSENDNDLNMKVHYKDECLDMDLRTLLAKPMTDFDFNVRVLNCLTSADIKTVGDLVRLSPMNLLRMRNMGKKSMKELESFMEDWHLRWGMDVDGLMAKDMVQHIISGHGEQ